MERRRHVESEQRNAGGGSDEEGKEGGRGKVTLRAEGSDARNRRFSERDWQKASHLLSLPSQSRVVISQDLKI